MSHIIRLATILLLALNAELAAASTFDDVVMQDHPVLYLTMGGTQRVAWEVDLARNSRGRRLPANWSLRTTMPNGDRATVFDGATQYLEVSSFAGLSVPTTGVLTIEAWIRPDTLQFPHQEGDGYVHWAGKGVAGAHEYALRMYSRTTTASPPRPNRISAYAFNLNGGLGSGSYFQDTIAVGQWIHVAAVINTNATSTQYPTGYVKIYRDGVLRDTTGLNQFDVEPGAGAAPFRIGTRDSRSFFKGAIGKVAVYNHELSASRLVARVNAMTGGRRGPLRHPIAIDSLEPIED